MAFSTINKDLSARFHLRHGRYIGPSSYTTGGDLAGTILSLLGLGRIESAVVGVARDSVGNTRLVSYDHTADSAVWVVPNTGAEVAALTDLSDYTVDYVVYGI